MNATIRTFRTAIRALGRNVMRSALTCLGIIIGVAAVIAMMEIGNGSSNAIQTTMSSMGANNLMIFPGTVAPGGVSIGAGSIMTMSPEDADAIARECPSVKAVAPVVRVRAQVVFGGKNWVPQQITGTTPEFLTVRDWSNLSAGDPFTDRDVRNGNKVCLVGQTIVRELFSGQSPIGKEIRIKNVSFKVVGVLNAKGANMMGQDQDDIILAPWTTVKYRVSGNSSTTGNQSVASASSSSTKTNSLSDLYPSSGLSLYPDRSQTQQADTPMPMRFINVDQIMASGVSAGQVSSAIKQITEVLRERHRIRVGQDDDFTIRDLAEVTKALSSTSYVMTILLLIVAGISLVVGGVGIMNIMLVSVTERTREIGLRMAVGARSADILRQFLIEAVLLCLLGGTIGIMLGRGGSIAVRMLMNWPTEVSIPAIIASVLVSALVGIIFGFVPAWKASRLDPIEALRYE